MAVAAPVNVLGVRGVEVDLRALFGLRLDEEVAVLLVAEDAPQVLIRGAVNDHLADLLQLALRDLVVADLHVGDVLLGAARDHQARLGVLPRELREPELPVADVDALGPVVLRDPGVRKVAVELPALDPRRLRDVVGLAEDPARELVHREVLVRGDDPELVVHPVELGDVDDQRELQLHVEVVVHDRDLALRPAEAQQVVRQVDHRGHETVTDELQLVWDDVALFKEVLLRELPPVDLAIRCSAE